MARKKDNSNLIWGIGFIVLAIILYWGGTQGWFNFIINISQQNVTLTSTPLQNQPTYSSCSQVCSDQGFSKGYTFISTCKVGESKVTYGYPGQNPLLTCCCYNESPPQPTSCGDSYPTCGGVCPSGYICNKILTHCSCLPESSGGYECTDSDGSNNFFVSGNCQDSFHMAGFPDYCDGMYLAWDYYCDDDNICQKNSRECYCNGGACMSCSQIINPINQNTCNLGICETGACTFIPATLVSPARCSC